MQTEQATTLNEQIVAILADWSVPGAAVTALHQGEIVLQQGFGLKDVTGSETVDAQTAFAIGSCTKSITAVALGLLVDEGKLKWDDTIITYLPDFELYDPWITRQVTVRDMLAHRVGLQRSLRLYQKGDMPKAEIVQRMRYLQPASGFRADFQYGNPHYTLAGQLVEVISGQSWAQFLRDRIFEPLGMTATYASLDEASSATDNITAAHAGYMEKVPDLMPQSAYMTAPAQIIPWQNIGAEPAGSVITCAADMVPWLNMLLNQGAPLLKPETMAAIAHPQITPVNLLDSSFAPFVMLHAPANFYAYGLGFYLMDYRSHKAIVGGGQIQGMNALFMAIPAAQTGLAVMVNTTHTLAHFAILLQLADHLLGKQDRPWNQGLLALADGLRQQTESQVQAFIAGRQAEIGPSLPVDAYAGAYRSDLLGEMTITLEGDTLHLHYGPGYAGTLQPWSGDAFVFTMTAPTVTDRDILQFQVQGGQVMGFAFRDGTVMTRHH